MTLTRKRISLMRRSILRRKRISRGSKLPHKRRKNKLLGKLLKDADKRFSLNIRSRDQHCQFPGCQSTKILQCSHYIGRAIKSTRFDTDNCIALCWFHHYKSKDLGYEYQKQTIEKHGYDGQYTKFMQQRLGPKKYKELQTRAQTSLKLSREFLQNKILELQSTDTSCAPIKKELI